VQRARERAVKVEELAQFAREQKEARSANKRKGFCRIARVEENPKCKLGFCSCRAVVFSDGKWVVVQGMVLLEEMSKEGFVQENCYSFKGRFSCKWKVGGKAKSDARKSSDFCHGAGQWTR
jgi:hypothetical protein